MTPHMLIDFDSQPMPAVKQVQAPAKPVQVTETISVVVAPSTSRGYLMKPDSAWTWSDLRDYVVFEIERCSGTFPRNQRKEQGIFSRFIAEFGPADSVAIARHAFEVCNGWWSNAPISVNRFCRGSDDFFGRPILSRISNT